MNEPNYEYEAEVNDLVLYQGIRAVVIEVDHDIHDARIVFKGRTKWVKQTELNPIRSEEIK